MRLQCGEAGAETTCDQRSRTRHAGQESPIALSLTVVGGFVDAVGYIALFQVFTANMSGNSVHVGMYLGQHEIGRSCCAHSAPSCPTLWEWL